MIAERLGYQFVDDEIVLRAAELEHSEVEDVAEVERRQTLSRRFWNSIVRRQKLETFGRGTMFPNESLPPGKLSLLTSEDHKRAIRGAIRETAEQGNVVIVSHGASVELAGSSDVLRVLITASAETRARRADPEGRVTGAGLRAVRATDRARADFLRRFYRVRREASIHYDLVINTDTLGYEDAAALVVAATGAPEASGS
jgi:hypothetical protein